MYIFTGKNRHNASLFIEENSTATTGAAYKISINDGAIVVVQSLGAAGQISVTLKIEGSLYKWYE